MNILDEKIIFEIDRDIFLKLSTAGSKNVSVYPIIFEKSISIQKDTLININIINYLENTLNNIVDKDVFDFLKIINRNIDSYIFLFMRDMNYDIIIQNNNLYSFYNDKVVKISDEYLDFKYIKDINNVLSHSINIRQPYFEELFGHLKSNINNRIINVEYTKYFIKEFKNIESVIENEFLKPQTNILKILYLYQKLLIITKDYTENNKEILTYHELLRIFNEIKKIREIINNKKPQC